MFFEHAAHSQEQPPNIRCDVIQRIGIPCPAWRRNGAKLSNHPATIGTERRLQAVLKEPSISVAAVPQRLPGRVEVPSGIQGSQKLLLRQP